MYNPCLDQGSDFQCEYILIINTSNTTFDISGFYIANAFNYTFPPSTFIPANGSISLGVGNCLTLNFDLSGGWDGFLTNINSETVELYNNDIEVYQMDGTLVDVVTNEKLGTGLQTITYNVEHLANGMYLYQVTSADKSYRERFTIAR